MEKGVEDERPENDAGHQPIRLLDSIRVNEAEGIHVPKSIARKPALNSHRKLASVLPKFGENTPEKGATTGKGHTKFLARLL